MAMTRQIFEFNDTGTAGDTGPVTFGFIHQMRWNPDAGDTGCDLQISLLPKAGDTGDGWLVVNDANVMGVQFVRVPGQRQHDSAGVTDTGLVPIALAGDRLRVKIVNQAGVATALQGRLYVWVG